VKILITGAAGLIGGNLARILTESGHEVVGLDIRVPAPSSVLSDVVDNVNFVVGDVGDTALVNRIVMGERVTHIMHAAAIAADQADAQPLQAIRVNINGTFNVLEAGRLFGLERVVVLSSSSVNGNHAGRPLDQPLTEADMDMPYGGMYPVHKLANEGQVQVFRRQYALSAVAIRPSRVWGPGYARFDLPIPVAMLVRDAMEGKDIDWPSGADIRMDITYVRDLCEGLVQALSVDSIPSPVYTLSSGRLVSVMEIVEVIRSVFPSIRISIGPGLDYDRGEVPYIIALKSYNDISLARSELGYDPTYGIEKGIPAYVAWLESRIYI